MQFLPRLPLNVQITDSNGNVTTTFQKWWQAFAEAIEKAVTDIQTNVGAIQAALDAAGIATAAAAAAQAAADAAQTTGGDAGVAAAAAAKEAAIVNSGTTGLTLTATDAGTNVTVTISNHMRVYGDGTSVAVTGGTITGLPYSSAVRIYYDDPTRAGGAVTYQYTVDPAVPPVQSGDRHSVGAVTTPAAAAAPATGRPVRQPGFVDLP